MRITVLDSFATDQGDAAMWSGLHALGEIDLHARTPAAEVVTRARGAQAILTNKVALTAAILAALPDLKFIGVTATGYNIIDVAAAAKQGVVVTNVPGYSTESVAQHVFALLLERTNDTGALSAEVKAGGWAAVSDFCFFRRPLRELAGKTLVIVGMGAIGGAVARIATAFGMRVIAAQVPGSKTPGRMALAEALPLADVVTLHCPSTPATERLVNASFLAALKPGAILVNTARGTLVDETAVAEALASGRLGALATDVLTREPPAAGHPLCDPHVPWADRVTITPHVAWGTVEARTRLIGEAVANLAAFQQGTVRNRVG